MNTSGTTSPPSRLLVGLAFAAIYIFWGSTYLAIRMVVETIPPFLSAGGRFVAAGALLFGFLWLRGVPWPTRAQWRHSAITGVLLLMGGNGLVVWAEQSVSSGRAALIVALAPVWFATLEWLRPGGKRPEPKTVLGILVGFCGVLLLVQGRGQAATVETTWPGVLAVIAAGISWASGSLYNRYSHNSASPWMNAASQMLCGGAALLALSALLGEPARWHWAQVDRRSVLALIYLVIFGSWVGFSAYVWLLKATTPGKISTYAYVNPVIAVFLGWAVLHEAVTPQMLWGALVILAGVVIITLPQTVLMDLASRRRAGAGSLLSPAVPK